MLLQEWQGFTHIDPIEGDVPAAPFDGRLLIVVSHARDNLKGRTHVEVKEMADYIASEFKTKKIDDPGHLLTLFPLPAEHPQYETPQYAATMALMLVNEALRLDGNAAAVAAIDATEAAAWIYLHFSWLPQHFDTAIKDARSDAARKAANAKHRGTNELKDFAIGLGKKERALHPKWSPYKIANEICAEVKRHGREVLNVELRKHRYQKTIYDWLLTADKKGQR